MKKNCNCAVCGKEVKFGKGYIGFKHREFKFCSKECYEAFEDNGKHSELGLLFKLTNFVEEVFEPADSTERAKLVEDAKECLEVFAMYQEKGYTLHSYEQTSYGLEREEFKYEFEFDVDFLKRVVEYINEYENEDFNPEWGFSQIYKYGKNMIDFEAQCENAKRTGIKEDEVVIVKRPSRKRIWRER